MRIWVNETTDWESDIDLKNCFVRTKVVKPFTIYTVKIGCSIKNTIGYGK